MVKLTQKQLKIVKEYFDKGLFLEEDGLIYKKCTDRCYFTVENY